MRNGPSHSPLYPSSISGPQTRNGVLCAHRQSIHPPAWPISNANVHIRASHIEGRKTRVLLGRRKTRGRQYRIMTRQKNKKNGHRPTRKSPALRGAPLSLQPMLHLPPPPTSEEEAAFMKYSCLQYFAGRGKKGGRDPFPSSPRLNLMLLSTTTEASFLFSPSHGISFPSILPRLRGIRHLTTLYLFAAKSSCEKLVESLSHQERLSSFCSLVCVPAGAVASQTRNLQKSRRQRMDREELYGKDKIC